MSASSRSRLRAAPSLRAVMCAATLIVPATARAQQQQPAPPAPGAPATTASDEEAMITRGVGQRRAGQDQQAFETFREAYERFRTPRAQAQLGLAAQALGRWLDADTHLRAALAAASDPWIAAHRAALESSRAVVEQRIAQVEVIGGVPGAEVFVNGQRVGTLPLPGPARAVGGTVALEVRAAGYVPLARTVTVAGGQFARESIELVPAPASAAATPAPATTAASATTSVRVTNGSGNATDGPRAQPRRGVSPALFAVGAGLTAVSGALLIWSGVTTLQARDVYVMDPTEQRFLEGVGLQTRTNVFVITTVVLGLATGAVGLFATDWSGGAPRRAATRARPFAAIDATRGAVVVGLSRAF